MSQRRFFTAGRIATAGLALTGLVLTGATSAAAHPHEGRHTGGHHKPDSGRTAHHGGAAHGADGGHYADGGSRDGGSHDGGSHDGGGSNGGAQHAVPVPAPAGQAPATGMVFLAADLRGANEVPAAGGPAAGDPDGHGRVIVRIHRDQVCFTLQYAAIDAPTAGHIHLGAAGANGAVKVGFFAGALPPSLRAVTGCVSQDPTTVDAILARPDGYYVNLHTAAHPGGALRGQLHRLDGPADLMEPLRAGTVAVLDGGQEVPEPGDPDGQATGFVRVRHHQLDFAMTWAGIAPPTAGHLHPGPAGQANPLVADLFASPAGLPASLRGVAGTVDADREVLKRVGKHPHEFYLNLHNAEFPKGAVRGQLFKH